MNAIRKLTLVAAVATLSTAALARPMPSFVDHREHYTPTTTASTPVAKTTTVADGKQWGRLPQAPAY